MYPAPLEGYDELAQVSVERFAQYCLELIDIRQSKNLSFATDICLVFGD